MTELAMQNLQTGLTITIIGMLVVLAFLTLMIFVMNITSNVIQVLNKYFPEAQIEPQTKKKKVQKNNDDEIAVAIAVAIAQERVG